MCFRLLLWSTNNLLKFNQPIEIHFSKGDQKKIFKKCFRKFIPNFVSSDNTSKPFYQTDSPWNGWCLSCLSFCPFFFFILAFHFCCSSTRLSQQCQKGPDLPKTAAVNKIQPLIWVFLSRLCWVYFAILERWLLFQSALPLISQLSKAAKFVLAVFSFWAFSGQVFQLFLSCPVWYPGINTPRHTNTHTHALVYPESWTQCCFHVIRVLKYFFHSSLKEHLTFLMRSL